jgi:DNA-binding response OmpR family regulator
VTEEGKRLCDDRTRILLVEDDGDTSFALSKLLDVEGFDVIRAADVAEAYYDALAVAPDLVVTDIDMPILSGLDLIRLFKQREVLADIPIIAVSAMERNRLQRAKSLGAAAAYQKPLDYERLISKIRALTTTQGIAAAASDNTEATVGQR